MTQEPSYKEMKTQNKWLNLSGFMLGLMKNIKSWKDMTGENSLRPAPSDSSVCPFVFRDKDAPFFHIQGGNFSHEGFIDHLLQRK